MKGYELTPHGGAYRLTPFDRPTAPPAAGQVRVRVRAAALNYRDLILLNNLAGRPVAGRVPLSDAAGEVSAVGPGVTRWRVGQRVAGCFFQAWADGPFDLAYHESDLGGSIDGVLAEEVVLREAGLVEVPAHLSFEEAACLPCAGLTAWHALVARGGLKPGETVLALGTGGASVFALQFAVGLGARVIVTSSGDDKLGRAEALGAAGLVNYRTHPDWDREVLRLTGGRGVDHVLEVGGPETLGKSMACLAAGGHLALIGVLTGFGPPAAGLFPLVHRNARASGVYVGRRADFEAMNGFLADRALRPVVDRVFPFEEASEAYRHVESGRHFGKVVIRL